MHSLKIVASIRRGVPLLAAAALAAPLLAHAADSHGAASTAYRTALEECQALPSHPSLAECRYEARSVQRDVRQGTLFDADPQTLERNALVRCDSVDAEHSDTCLRLAKGEGLREGSLAEGAMVMWMPEQDLQFSVNDER